MDDSDREQLAKDVEDVNCVVMDRNPNVVSVWS